MRDTPSYRLIAAHYAARRAERSQVPLIHHIDEGLWILDAMGSSAAASAAWCLHPLLQADDDLVRFVDDGLAAQVPPHALLLAMEYRLQANAWLSDKVSLSGGDVRFEGEPGAGPLAEVRQMLIADKVQNYKDFLAFHASTHPRRLELDAYFRRWLAALDVRDDRFAELCALVDRKRAGQ